MLHLQATHLELEKVKEQSEVKVHQLEAQLETQTGSLKRDLADLEQKAAHLGQQKVQLQQNNTKLVLTNLMLMNKAKQLEDNSRALVAKQEDLQHQVRYYLLGEQWAPILRTAELVPPVSTCATALSTHGSSTTRGQQVNGGL